MLWIAVTLPLLPLEAVRPPVPHSMSSMSSPASPEHGFPSDASGVHAGCAVPSAPRCYALADPSRVLIPDLDALGLGVSAGCTRSHALALAPDLVLLNPDPAREQQAFEALALALLAYTPKLSFAESHTLLLEVGSGLRLFGGIRALLAKVAATVADCGHVARIACAPTAWGAWLLAQSHAQRTPRRWHVVQDKTLPRVLDALPVSLAPFAAQHDNALLQIGCATLADLRRLPREGVVRRFGDGVLTWLAQAYGEHPDPRESFRAPPSFQAALELQARVDSAEALLFAARRLVMQLAGWLAAQHAAVSAFELRLEHELASRHADPLGGARTSSLTIGWAAPSRDADHLLWLLRERLNQTELAAPVIGLRLVASEVREYAAPTDTLFPLPEASDASLAQLFERIGARLGPQNVLQLSLVDDHRPEHAMQADAWRAPARRGRAGTRRKAKDAKDDSSAADAPVQTTLDLPDVPLPSQPRPAWLLERPLKLATRGDRPVYRRPLKTLTRAERVESGWWDGDGVGRDYYVAADDQGRMFWVYRERIGGQWYLQGLFG
ncbi:Y-family DNA polymerase [Paraburkholderia caballeronis]|uniref:Y-family DNA polymerase n=1 Tax=Paraburkholderia caballeronis TaxID=416943 RepID=UPI001066BEBC|nr:DNA polymerase Y family protein [Paraburkholderia caballeronis]